MVPDGRGGMQCTPRHVCLGARAAVPAVHKRVRTRSDRKNRKAARLRSRPREQRNHRQPPMN
jgi:hypothetical protein